jgi:hypothetical protein
LQIQINTLIDFPKITLNTPESSKKPCSKVNQDNKFLSKHDPFSNFNRDEKFDENDKSLTDWKLSIDQEFSIIVITDDEDDGEI